MTLDEFYLKVKPGRIRLPGCEIYMPAPGGRTGYRKLDGGRAVFVEKSTDTTGLAVVGRQVVSVSKVDHVRWNVA